MVKKNVVFFLAAFMSAINGQALNGGAQFERETGAAFNPEPVQPHVQIAVNNIRARIERAADSVPADKTVVERELAELNSIIGNYKNVHQTEAVHHFVKKALSYNPDGHPLQAATPEDRLLRELKRTAEVVRKFKGDQSNKIQVEGKIKYPEPESLDPATIMAKKAYEVLPVENGEHDAAQENLDRVAAAHVKAAEEEAAKIAKENIPAGARRVVARSQEQLTTMVGTQENIAEQDEQLPADDGLLKSF